MASKGAATLEMIVARGALGPAKRYCQEASWFSDLSFAYAFLPRRVLRVKGTDHRTLRCANVSLSSLLDRKTIQTVLSAGGRCVRSIPRLSGLRLSAGMCPAEYLGSEFVVGRTASRGRCVCDYAMRLAGRLSRQSGRLAYRFVSWRARSSRE